MNYGLIAALAVAIIAVAALGLSLVFARVYCRPKRLPGRHTPADLGLPFSELPFASGDTELPGWLLAPDGADNTERPVLVLAHGWSGSAASLLPTAKRLFAEGYDIFLYDARGHGKAEDDGPITLDKMGRDLLAAVGAARRSRGNCRQQVGVVGHSMGAAAAVFAASVDPDIGPLLLVAPFVDPKRITYRYMRGHHIAIGPLTRLVFRILDSWTESSMNDISPLNRIQQVETEVVIMRGTRDSFVWREDVEDLVLAGRSGAVRDVELEERGHFDILRSAQLLQCANQLFATKTDAPDLRKKRPDPVRTVPAGGSP